MVPPQPSLPDGASTEMEDYLAELIDISCLANETYDDITSEDMVVVLRHCSAVYGDYGVSATHPRNQDGQLPTLDGLFQCADDGTLKPTARRGFIMDVGFKTGLMHGRDISDSEMATVLAHLADFIETHGRTAVTQ